MDCPPASVDSTVSWNTFLSRTSVSTLACAIFSEQQGQLVNGLEDVIRAVRLLQLRRYRYEELAREEALGEGETYLVEKAVHGGDVVAIKHLKLSSTPDERVFRRRLSAVTIEAQIMRHSPLRAHPNFPSVIGYGWNLREKLIIPFLVVEYAPSGTLREYVQKVDHPLSDIEILLGDVLSALAALHTCGIVHGDVKLDNVLVFPSSDRPCKALAKLTDFGHALILNGKSKTHDDEIIKYRGTFVYNAPEVKSQDLFPIDRGELWKCDIWAFGLLVWEACIRGEEYIKYLARNGVVINTPGNDHDINVDEMLQYAKRCLPIGKLGTAMFLRIVLHKTIREDPLQRAASIRDLPLFTRWNTGNVLGLEADLALHFEASTPTYEMFRLDTGKEMLWNHQHQMFQDLKRTYTDNSAGQRGAISWQIALCFHVGFGTARDAQSAYEYSEMARAEFHPLAMAFGHLLDPQGNSSSQSTEESYAAKVTRLLRSNSTYSKAMPILVKAFFDGNSPAIFDLLSKGIALSSFAIDGCSPFHWLFMFQGTILKDIVEKLSGRLNQRLVNLPMCSMRKVHDQWPLHLSGSPLAIAISVNSLPAVKALLSLGANPFSLVYGRAQFASDDVRSQWTAFHIAGKYHCSEILSYLLEQTNTREQTSINSLACVLSSSTTLERLAMHGSNHTQQLDETIRPIHMIQPLEAMDTHGRTGLMLAIDSQDYQVVAALLRANKELAKTPFISPKSSDIFNYPVHFLAQIAARRDGLETLLIPKLLNSYTDDLRSGLSSRDYMRKTPLHLAVTGSSSVVTSWILEEHIELLHAEDSFERTPLHYCASSVNFHVLLNKGADINHVDKRGMTALHSVCLRGASDLAACLLRWKPRLDLRDNIYGTPLHCGVISGSIDVVMTLVEQGAQIDVVDMNGNTALHVAAKLNHPRIFRLLIQRGAQTGLRNINGRDAKDIALHAARNVGILTILQHERNAHENLSILDVVDDDMTTFSLEDQPTGGIPPDFLWDEDSMYIEEPDESTNMRQNVDEDSYMYEEQHETYDQREEKLEKLDEITSVVTQYLPCLYQDRRAATAVVTLLSVFFDDVIWQPDIASRMIEIIVRAACDLACIVQFQVEKSRPIRRRIQAWTKLLTTHDGVLLKDKDQLDQFWNYMEGHDPVEMPLENHIEPYAWPRKEKRDGAVYTEQISLSSLLGCMSKTFPIETKSVPAYLNQNVEVLDEFDIRYMVEGRESFEQGRRANSKREVERRREVDGGRESLRAEEPTREEWKPEHQLVELRLDPVSRPKVVSFLDHVNQAIDWITTIVVERKPRTMFPGRQKSDIEDMAQWEFEALKPRAPNFYALRYSTTLFDFFPQLSGHLWEEDFSRKYLQWKHKKAFEFLRDEHQAAWAAQIEFFKNLYASCVQMQAGRKSGTSVENMKLSKASSENAEGKTDGVQEVCRKKEVEQ